MVPLNDFPEKKSLSDLREIEKNLTTEKRIRLFWESVKILREKLNRKGNLEKLSRSTKALKEIFEIYSDKIEKTPIRDLWNTKSWEPYALEKIKNDLNWYINLELEALEWDFWTIDNYRQLVEKNVKIVGFDKWVNIDEKYSDFYRYFTIEYINFTWWKIETDLKYLKIDEKWAKKILEKVSKKVNIWDLNLELNTLVNFAIERTNLEGFDCNKKLYSLNNKNYDKLYYLTKDKNISKISDWYQIVDYFTLANIKQKTGDISAYTLMLEPIIVRIYLSILKDLMKINLEKLFKRDTNGYKIELKRLEEGLKKMLKEDLKKTYLKDDVYISAQVLTCTIKYYLKKEKKLDINYFNSFSKTLAKIKNVRNTLAHELKSINREDFNRESGTTIEQVNTKILDFFEKFYKQYGYKKEMVEVYDNLNKEINKLLE